MVPDQADRTIAFRPAYGKAAPPEKVTQEAFEGNDRHLRRLQRMKPGERPDLQDLWEYLQDLRYTDIQSSLLAYLFPFSLELRCEDVRGTSDKYGGFVEHLYPVLADRAILDKHLTSKQSAAVSEFMRQTILEEVDDQLGLAYQGSKARPPVGRMVVTEHVWTRDCRGAVHLVSDISGK
jgi:hypothetical protein